MDKVAKIEPTDIIMALKALNQSPVFILATSRGFLEM